MVRAIHEVARYDKVYIVYNALLSRKLQYPATSWYQKCQILQLLLYIAYFLSSNAWLRIRSLGRGSVGFPVCPGKSWK
jgi:hypothetical protein